MPAEVVKLNVLVGELRGDRGYSCTDEYLVRVSDISESGAEVEGVTEVVFSVTVTDSVVDGVTAGKDWIGNGSQSGLECEGGSDGVGSGFELTEKAVTLSSGLEEFASAGSEGGFGELVVG